MVGGQILGLDRQEYRQSNREAADRKKISTAEGQQIAHALVNEDHSYFSIFFSFLDNKI